MTDIETVTGQSPLLVTFSHTGTIIPEDIAPSFVSRDLALKDTDWWIEKLYSFVREVDATTVRTPFSRSVIDVNRDPSGRSLYPGQATTSLVPVEAFDGEPLYKGETPTDYEIQRRRSLYFDPFHAAIENQIARLLQKHRQIVLFDCHSIRTHVPRLFEGTLPTFNIGTNGGSSCAQQLQQNVTLACGGTGLSLVVNGRFRGGWITRNYGRPERGIHAIQMELAQSFYMDERTPSRFPDERTPTAMKALRKVMATVTSFV